MRSSDLSLLPLVKLQGELKHKFLKSKPGHLYQEPTMTETADIGSAVSSFPITNWDLNYF